MLTFSKLKDRPRALQRLTGLPLPVFVRLAAALESTWCETERLRLERPDRKRAIGAGHPYSLRHTADKLLAFLALCRQGLTYEFGGFLFDLTACNMRQLVLRMAPAVEAAADPKLACELHDLWEKRRKQTGNKVGDWKTLLGQCPDLQQVAVDTFHHACFRPGTKRRRRQYYAGKVKRFTIKCGIVAGSTGRIVHVGGSCPGTTADQVYYEQERLHELMPPRTRQLADSGFQGVQKLCPGSNLLLPFRRPSPGCRGRGMKGPPLTRAQKRANTLQRKDRVVVEHRLAAIRGFRILSDTWRSRPQTHNRFVRAIAAVTNLRLAA
jgi:DDE superfamily endonuclease